MVRRATLAGLFLVGFSAVALGIATLPELLTSGVLLISGLTLVATAMYIDDHGHQGRIEDLAQPETPLEADRGAAAFAIDANNNIVAASRDVHAVTGWHHTEITGLALMDYVDAPDMPRCAEALESVRTAGEMVTLAIRVRNNGQWESVNAHLSADTGGRVRLDQTTARQTDHPALRATDAGRNHVLTLTQLALSGADMATLIQHLTDVVRSHVRADEVQVYRINGGRLTSMGSDTAVGPNPRLAIDQLALAATDTSTSAALTGTSPEVVALPPSGEPLRGVAIPVMINDDVAAVLALTLRSRTLSQDDIGMLTMLGHTFLLASQRSGASAAAQHNAAYDQLTGLANKQTFLERLESVLARRDKTDSLSAVFFLDLDNFALVNDGYGHATGDVLLELLADRLDDALRPGDFLARFGGDEFTIVAEGIDDADHAIVMASRLLGALNDPFVITGEKIQMSASVGVALVVEGCADSGTLLQQADAAMVQAKQDGRSTARLFQSSMLESAMTRLRTEKELRRALEDGQLRVFYQPVVDLQSGQTVSVEALIRWLHPGRGLVTPDEFIPISEETALIEEIGTWVFREAAQQAATWDAEGRPLPISVNVAARQFMSTSLLHTVDRAIADTGVRPELLIVEITETNLVEDLARAAAVVTALQERKIAVAVDDFGTGYSSLTYLRSLPIDIIKIDREFVHGLTRTASDYTITAAVISLARALGKTVVAEGVETEGQLTVLRELSCDQAQGYLFSPAVIPTPVNEPTPEWTELVLGGAH